jgi:hypothetical protein
MITKKCGCQYVFFDFKFSFIYERSKKKMSLDKYMNLWEFFDSPVSEKGWKIWSAKLDKYEHRLYSNGAWIYMYYDIFPKNEIISI